MVLNNRLYDCLKWIALVGLPPLAGFYLALGKLWNLPYPEQIAETILLVDTLLGTWLGVSSVKYAKKLEIEKEEK